MADFKYDEYEYREWLVAQGATAKEIALIDRCIDLKEQLDAMGPLGDLEKMRGILDKMPDVAAEQPEIAFYAGVVAGRLAEADERNSSTRAKAKHPLPISIPDSFPSLPE